MKPTVTRKLHYRKRRLTRRLDKTKLGDCSQPMFTARNIHYEISDRSRGITHGGTVYTYHLRQGVDWNTSPPRQVTASDFIREFIFPGGMLPSPRRFVEAARRGIIAV